MSKIVALKFPDICWGCKTMKGKGTMVMWLGTKTGIYCFPTCWFNYKKESVK